MLPAWPRTNKNGGMIAAVPCSPFHVQGARLLFGRLFLAAAHCGSTGYAGTKERERCGLWERGRLFAEETTFGCEGDTRRQINVIGYGIGKIYVHRGCAVLIQAQLFVQSVSP